MRDCTPFLDLNSFHLFMYSFLSTSPVIVTSSSLVTSGGIRYVLLPYFAMYESHDLIPLILRYEVFSCLMVISRPLSVRGILASSFDKTLATLLHLSSVFLLGLVLDQRIILIA